jgi:hypothetical protein
MRKKLLAMAALMGVAVLPAHAWRVSIDKDSYADISFGTQAWGRYEGKRTTADRSATNFYVNLADIIVKGQVNNLVYFSIDARSENPGLNQSFKVKDAYVGLKFADGFRVQAGAMRVPFSRATLTSEYTFLIPTQVYGGTVQIPITSTVNLQMPDNVYRGLFINPTDALGVLGDGSRDAGIVVWGNVAEGMLKYYLGVSDGRFDRRGGFFTDTTKDSLAYTIRLQFTPTMLGFKPETAYTLSDTYLGKQNVLTLGVGYRAVKAETTGLNYNYSKTAKLWTVDMLYERKFGDIVPNLQVGYIQAKDVPFYFGPMSGSIGDDVAYGKATQIYAQAQLLYDQVVGFGKPALAIRWEQNKNKDIVSFDTGDGTTTTYTDNPKNTRLGVFAHYYIKGQAAKISFGVDSVNRNTDSKGANGKSFTDITLHLQTQF